MRIGLTACAIQRGASAESRYLHGLLRALLADATKHEFVLFVLETDLPQFEFARSAAQIVPVAELHRSPLRNVLWHQVALPRLAQEHALDVVHVPTHRRLLWPRPCGLVATIHRVRPVPTGQAMNSDAAERHFLLSRLVRRQDEIVTITETTAAELVDRVGLRRDRVTVIPNGIDHVRFTPNDREGASARIARRYGVRPPFFVCVAPLDHPDANHTRLITAFSLFKTMSPSPWRLVLVGRDGKGAAKIHETIRHSPYAQDVQCAGSETTEDLADWYRAAGALVHVPLTDTDSQVPIEAMACGCPTIVSRLGAVGELAAGAGVAIDPGSLDELRRVLGRMAADADLRQRLSEAGRAHARRFDWQHAAAATLDVYARAARRVKEPLVATAALTRAAP